MNAECFLDTNILVYAATGRGAEEKKRARALELIQDEDFAVSAQVLQEFYVTVVRKVKVPMAPATAVEWVEALEAFPCVPIDAPLVKVAAELSVLHQVSYWDAAVLAAAQIVGAGTVYSEDLADGQAYGSVTVRNPFR